MNTASKHLLAAPRVFIVDVRDVLLRFSPGSPALWYLYEKDPVLTDFIRKFTIQNIIAAEFADYADVPSETNVWAFIEHMFPTGTGEFEESYSAMDGFMLLVDMVVEAVDILLERRLACYGASSSINEYRFDSWINPHSVAFAHRSFIPPR